MTATWNTILATSPLTGRDSARGFEMGGRFFISSGYKYGGGNLLDLWSTTNPENSDEWTCINSAIEYEPYSAMLPCGAYLYACRTQLWKSTDGGVTFVQVNYTMPFEVTENAPVFFVDGKWIIVVSATQNQPAGVWKFDPATETFSKIGTPLNAGRSAPAYAKLGDALYMFGGHMVDQPNEPPETGYPTYTTLADAEVSYDGGVTWVPLDIDLPWEPRMWSSACTFNDKIYFVGGWDNIKGGLNSTDTFVFSPEEGMDRVLTVLDYKQRHASLPFQYNGRLYQFGGNSNPNNLGDGQNYTRNDLLRLDF